MFYVEWLRVRNVLRVTAIILGIVLLCGLIGRVLIERYLTYDHLIKHAQMDPGTKTSHSVLPDGTQRTTLDSPDGTHIVLDDRGYAGKHVVIVERGSGHKSENVAVGSVRVQETNNGKTQTTVVDTNAPMLFVPILAAGSFAALLIGTILGAPFARENDGHLEIALTRPRSRELLALGTAAVDIAGMVIAGLMVIVFAVLMISIYQFPTFDFAYTGMVAPLCLFGPIAWYAMLCAATASMKRNYGAVLGFAWPVAIALPALSLISFGDSVIGGLVHQGLWLVSRIDPLSYISLNFRNSSGSVALMTDPIAQAFAEIGLFVIYVILAVAQWRRVEA